MARRIAGAAAIGMWSGLVVVAVVAGFQGLANGQEEIFRNLPEGWKVEKSVVVSANERAALSRKLGARISRLTNTFLSIEGKRLQVNIIHCRTTTGAEKVCETILKAHGGLAVTVARDGNMVVEFARCDDVELMRKARQGLGLVKLDDVSRKVIKKIPAGWQLEDSFIAPRDQTAVIAKKLGGRVKRLSNAIFSVHGRHFQVNVFECPTQQDARKINESILRVKPDPAFCVMLGDFVVEFVADDSELARKAVYELGFKDRPLDAPERQFPGRELSEGPPEAKGAEGLWLGTLKSFGVEVEIVFEISKKTDTGLAATMNIPVQRAENMPVDKVTLENGSLRLEMKSMMAVFEGTMRADSPTIDGQWKQGGQTVPLTLKRVDEVPKLRRPQEPKKPYPYKEEEVMYENKKAGIKLAGTLTLPPSDGPFPAVLLISGSGIQDRNETVFGHRPFLVLADYLTRQGLAVLRVDDRGVGGSTGSMPLFFESTSEDFAEDVLAGIDYLKTRSEIDPEKIGLIGHSEGGIIAPMVAAQSNDVAFIVLMAGTGLVGQEVLYLQSDLILKAVGASHQARATQRAALEETFNILKHEKDNATAETKIHNLMKDTLAKLSADEKEALGFSEGMLELQIKMALSAWFRFFVTYDPKPTLMKVKCPVLAIVGEKDLQVAPKQNLHAIEEALKAGGNENYTVKELPSLNHLFQTAETGSLAEYAKIEETVSPAALELIGDWINKFYRTKRKP
ncbi:MAG: alpha/beta hydrolase family protein [Planctomycetota bacterium]|jgi:fermentation-respiration switch protein FrsA (DUF1100 family)